MPALDLDYIPGVRRAMLARALLAAVATALSIDVALRYGVAKEAVAAKEVRLAKSLRPSSKMGEPIKAREVGTEEYSFARQTVKRLTTPWDELFYALERAQTDGVGLLSLEPNAETRQVTLIGEAKDYLALLSYVATLSSQPQLSDVRLQRHETRREPGASALSFTILAAWKESR